MTEPSQREIVSFVMGFVVAVALFVATCRGASEYEKCVDTCGALGVAGLPNYPYADKHMCVCKTAK